MKEKAKIFSAYDVALYFLFIARKDNAGDTISNLKIQKMLYYAQGEFLAFFDVALFPEKIEAWKHGPVVKKIYDNFRKYGKLAIDFKELENFRSEIYTKEHLDFLPFIYKKYNSLSAWDLAQKTHKETPWLKNYTENNTNEIPLKDLKEFFKKSLEYEIRKLKELKSIDEDLRLYGFS